MSSPTSTWSDRRGLHQRGKEVHEPTERRSSGAGIAEAVRRASTSSNDGLEKTMSGSSAGGYSSQRRRSSNAGAGLFNNLQAHKRGSQDYGERRASLHEHRPSGGLFSGWYNKTFRGVQPNGQPLPTAQQVGGEQKRGVME